MWTPPVEHPLRRFFAGLTEDAFLVTLGVADPPLVDYVSGLLSRFVHIDQIYRLNDARGRRLEGVVAMLLEAAELPEGGRTRREVYRHIGDFALYWSGLYPDAVRRMNRHSADGLIDYCREGSRSYLIASDCGTGDADEDAVLYRLGKDFALCAAGLREVRRGWEEGGERCPAGPLIGP